MFMGDTKGNKKEDKKDTFVVYKVKLQNIERMKDYLKKQKKENDNT